MILFFWLNINVSYIVNYHINLCLKGRAVDCFFVSNFVAFKNFYPSMNRYLYFGICPKKLDSTLKVPINKDFIVNAKEKFFFFKKKYLLISV